jgi:CheY-like chemotaxis protein
MSPAGLQKAMPASNSPDLDRPLSILVVDDEEPVREVVSWMLEDAGHDVHEASDAEQALHFLHRNGPVDLVLSDINMPGMDGMELCRQVRQEWPGVAVLLISGRPPPNGARPFIPKPFRWDTLARAIAAMTDRHPAVGAGPPSRRPHA